MTPEQRASDLAAAWFGKKLSLNQMSADIAAALREAVAAEREACAVKIEEQCRMLTQLTGDGRHEALCRDLAAAIRGRKP